MRTTAFFFRPTKAGGGRGAATIHTPEHNVTLAEMCVEGKLLWIRRLVLTGGSSDRRRYALAWLVSALFIMTFCAVIGLELFGQLAKTERRLVMPRTLLFGPEATAGSKPSPR